MNYSPCTCEVIAAYDGIHFNGSINLLLKNVYL